MRERLEISNQPELVMSCAWCVKPGTEPPLPKGKAYSHEICGKHLREQTRMVQQRARLRRQAVVVK